MFCGPMKAAPRQSVGMFPATLCSIQPNLFPHEVSRLRGQCFRLLGFCLEILRQPVGSLS